MLMGHGTPGQTLTSTVKAPGGSDYLSLFARASFTFRQYELLSLEMRHIPDGRQSQGPLRIQ